MEWIILWVILAAIAGSIAKSKGHSAAAYFFCSLIFSALVAIPLALIAKPNTARLEDEEILQGRARRCPQCAELVKPEAIKCKHCGAELPPPPPEPPGLFARIFGGK